MYKLDMFHARFEKIDNFEWWDLEKNSADAGTEFTSINFQDECQTRGVWITLEAMEHKEMNVQVKVTLRTFHTIAHSLMVHAQVSDVYIHLPLMYTADHILPVLPIKELISKDSDPNTPNKLATCMKPSIFHLRILFCPCVVRKSTTHVGTKALDTYYQAQKGFCGIFVGILQHKKGILFMYHTNRK